jgi:anti-sigma B factor antagonist
LQIVPRPLDQTTTILDVTGDINLTYSPEVRKALLRELRENHTTRVVVNLKGVRYIDSSGIASLVEALKASRDTGSRLILFGLSPIAYEVLRLSKLVPLFEIYDNEEQALEAKPAQTPNQTAEGQPKP